MARQLIRDEAVASISPQTVRRIPLADRLKPWRSHVWLHPRTPRDATFAAQVRAVADLLTRVLGTQEVVLSLHEMTFGGAPADATERHVDATRPPADGRAARS